MPTGRCTKSTPLPGGARAIEKQASEELGQWTEKQVPLGSAAVRTSITVRFIKPGPPDDLGRYIPLDSPHQVVKLIETTAGVHGLATTRPGDLPIYGNAVYRPERSFAG